MPSNSALASSERSSHACAARACFSPEAAPPDPSIRFPPVVVPPHLQRHRPERFRFLSLGQLIVGGVLWVNFEVDGDASGRTDLSCHRKLRIAYQALGHHELWSSES